MGMKAIFYFAALSTVLGFSGCSVDDDIRGRGSKESTIRAVENFDRIYLHHPAELTVFEDTAFYVELSDYENLLPYIRTRLSGSTLLIDVAPHVDLHNSRCKMIIHLPKLKEIQISGSGEVDVKDNFVDLNRAQISGSGRISLDQLLHNGSFSAQIDGSGKISANGQVQNLDCRINGSGRFEFLYLKAAEVSVNIAGSGTALLNADQRLYARIDGSGKVRYTGNPLTEVAINGSGSVQRY